jgi:membrane fusion protein, copper/silver efflux system
MRRPAKVLITLVAAAGVFLAGYLARRPPVPPASSGSTRQAVTYSCPMHPQYTADRPGDCPICGMRLEPVTPRDSGVKADSAGLDVTGTVVVGAASQQLIGVATDEVRRGPSSQVLRVPGRIAVDEQRLFRIIAAVDGWIVDLRPNTVGRSVTKDQLLATYYTPNLLYNERLFLLSIPANEPTPTATKDFSQASIRTAGSANPQFPVDSLRGLGMSDLQIEEIHKTRTAAPHVSIYSPVSGFVLARNISPGQRFDKGTELYRIADISRVWVMTDIFEKDRQFLKPGAEATILYQGRRLKARMTDALPQFDPQSRTLKTRFELDNPDHLLQPDMFVDVELDVEMPPAITVPADAVFDSGLRKTVFVDRGNGHFEARRVETGWRLGGRVEIVRGLMEGERVAGAANFLLDSESRMRAVSAGIFNAETDPVCGMEVDQKKAGAAGRTATQDGSTYYFCSDECKKKFEAEPAKYLDPHNHAPSTAPPAAKAPMAGMPPAKSGGQAAAAMVKDVVCGMDIDPKDAAGKVEYEGKTYYFCTLECKTKFEKAPKQYVK